MRTQKDAARGLSSGKAVWVALLALWTRSMR